MKTYQVFTMPIRTVNSTNAREHWAPKSRRAKKERQTTALLCASLTELRDFEGLITVSLTRYSPGTMDDDGLRAALKHVRDEVAALVGRDDAPGCGVTWFYEQEKSKTHSVRVEVECQKDKI